MVSKKRGWSEKRPLEDAYVGRQDPEEMGVNNYLKVLGKIL